MRARFQQALRELQDESPSMHTLRHGGASHDLLTMRRPLREVKDRGRWISDKSLRRYAKAAKMQQRIAALPQHVVQLGTQVELNIHRLLVQPSAAVELGIVLPCVNSPAPKPLARKAPVITRRWTFT